MVIQDGVSCICISWWSIVFESSITFFFITVRSSYCSTRIHVLMCIQENMHPNMHGVHRCMMTKTDDISEWCKLSSNFEEFIFTIYCPAGFVLGKKSLDKRKSSNVSEGNSNYWEINAKYKSITYWNHDSLPSQDDAFLRSFHWLAVAKTVSFSTSYGLWWILIHQYMTMCLVYVDCWSITPLHT